MSTAPATVVAAASGPRGTDTFTVEDLVSLRAVGEVAPSPDGSRVAYTVRTPPDPSEGKEGSRSVIWLVDRKGGEPRRYTAEDVSSYHVRWSPDGRTLAFLSKRKGDDVRQIYAIDPAGGEPRRISQSASSIASFEWSSDGKRIFFVADRPDEPEEKEAKSAGRDWVIGDVQGTFRRLWSVEVATGTAQPLSPREYHIEAFAVSPDDRRVVVRAGKRADIDAVMMYSGLFSMDTAGGTLQPLTSTQGKLGHFEWSPDGKQIAFLSAVDLHDPTAGVLKVVSSDGGTARALTAEYEGTGQWLRWTSPDEIALLTNEGSRTKLYRVDARSGKMKAVFDGEEDPVCSSADLSADKKLFACAGSRPRHPREVFVGSMKKGKLERLTNSNPWLDAERLGEQEVIRWKATDGLEIEGVLTKPVGYERGKRYPLAVLVHGGPEGISHDGWGSYAGYPVQLFAARGFVVLQPNYRGSQGRGVAFGKADQGDLGGKEFEDVLAGIDHLIEQGLVDADRVGMGGWSYGGYFSGLAATKHSARFKVAMVGAAITDWISFTGTTEIEHENSLVHWNLWPWENHALAWERSPVAHAKDSKTATLIVHGSSDTRVPPEQAVELYRALRHFGAKTELVLYPREGHGLRAYAHQLDFAERFVAWFEAHLGD